MLWSPVYHIEGQVLPVSVAVSCTTTPILPMVLRVFKRAVASVPAAIVTWYRHTLVPVLRAPVRLSAAVTRWGLSVYTSLMYTEATSLTAGRFSFGG